MVDFSFYSASADNDSSDVGSSCFYSCVAFDAHRTSYGLYVLLIHVPTKLVFPCSINRSNSNKKILAKCSASARMSVLDWYCWFIMAVAPVCFENTVDRFFVKKYSKICIGFDHCVLLFLLGNLGRMPRSQTSLSLSLSRRESGRRSWYAQFLVNCRFHTRGRTNRLDGQIVLRRTNRHCSSDVKTGRTNFSTNKSSDIWPSGKTIFPRRFVRPLVCKRPLLM